MLTACWTLFCLILFLWCSVLQVEVPQIHPRITSEMLDRARSSHLSAGKVCRLGLQRKICFKQDTQLLIPPPHTLPGAQSQAEGSDCNMSFPLDLSILLGTPLCCNWVGINFLHHPHQTSPTCAVYRIVESFGLEKTSKIVDIVLA